MDRGGIAVSHGNSVSAFLRNRRTVFHSAAPSYILTGRVEVFPFFFTLSPAFVIYRLFNDGSSDWCEV